MQWLASLTWIAGRHHQIFNKNIIASMYNVLPLISSFGLATNRARVRISTMPQGLWPRLLRKPNSVFSLRGWIIPKWCHSSSISYNTVHHTAFPESEAMFLLLRDHTNDFVALIQNRKSGNPREKLSAKRLLSSSSLQSVAPKKRCSR